MPSEAHLVVTHDRSVSDAYSPSPWSVNSEGHSVRTLAPDRSLWHLELGYYDRAGDADSQMRARFQNFDCNLLVDPKSMRHVLRVFVDCNVLNWISSFSIVATVHRGDGVVITQGLLQVLKFNPGTWRQRFDFELSGSSLVDSYYVKLHFKEKVLVSADGD